jgi:hypothetical protein
MGGCVSSGVDQAVIMADHIHSQYQGKPDNCPYTSALAAAECAANTYTDRRTSCQGIVENEIFAKWRPLVRIYGVSSDRTNCMGLTRDEVRTMLYPVGTTPTQIVVSTRPPVWHLVTPSHQAILLTSPNPQRCPCLGCKVCVHIGKWEGIYCRVPGCTRLSVTWDPLFPLYKCCKYHNKNYKAQLVTSWCALFRDNYDDDDDADDALGGNLSAATKPSADTSSEQPLCVRSASVPAMIFDLIKFRMIFPGSLYTDIFLTACVTSKRHVSIQEAVVAFNCRILWEN